MTAVVNQPEPTNLPEDQRVHLLACYHRDLGYAYGWLEETDVKAERLARIHYLIESARRLEQAVLRLQPDPATDTD